MAIEKKPDGLVFASSSKLGEMVQFPNIGRGWGIAFEQTNGIPSMEHFNHLFNRIDSSIVYILQQGIPEWNENIDYPKGAIIKHGERTYKALSSNKNKEVSLSQYWVDTDSSLNVIHDMLIGVPIPHPLSTVPEGCLAMNGQRFDASRYPKLAKKYPSGQLPDLRGEFIRGWDNGRGVDAGRVVLSAQEEELKSHNHEFGIKNGDSFHQQKVEFTAKTDGINGNGYSSIYMNKSDNGGDKQPYSGAHWVGIKSSGGKETRPRNIAFHYICLAA